MCEPTLIAISLGAAQAVTGIAQQNAAWANQRNAVLRSNHMATTKYANELTIAEYNDKLKGLVFEKELNADAAAQTELAAIRQNNQISADQASTAAQIAANEKLAEQAFKSQENLAKSIQAQGEVLASGAPAGNSLGALLQGAEREFGFEQAQIDASQDSVTRAYAIEQYGIDLDKYSADIAAINQTKSIATHKQASYEPIKPIMQEVPKKPSILGPILSGITTGLGAYNFAGGTFSFGSTTAPAGQQYGAMRSDIALKENITYISKSPDGHRIYEWNYKGEPKSNRFQGVLAQELLQTAPHAVVKNDNGYFGVDYTQIDVNLRSVVA
jgi:hypothetical protein